LTESSAARRSRERGSHADLFAEGESRRLRLPEPTTVRDKPAQSTGRSSRQREFRGRLWRHAGNPRKGPSQSKEHWRTRAGCAGRKRQTSTPWLLSALNFQRKMAGCTGLELSRPDAGLSGVKPEVADFTSIEGGLDGQGGLVEADLGGSARPNCPSSDPLENPETVARAARLLGLSPAQLAEMLRKGRG
jgi:hypothetical protein